MMFLYLLLSLISLLPYSLANQTVVPVLSVTPAMAVSNKKIRSASESESNTIQEVKHELDRAVHNLNATAREMGREAHNAIVVPISELESCGPLECNNRGTCLGTRKTFICACKLGFSGRLCEETVCDSARDCNGRGICLGTTTALTCLCNLGFTGQRCETAI